MKKRWIALAASAALLVLAVLALLPGTGPGDSREEIIDLSDPQVPLADLPVEAEDYAAAALELINAARAENGLPALSPLPGLDTAAAIRAGELLESFSHTRPDGTRYRTAMEELDVAGGWTAENAAMGYKTPEDLVAGWMKSDGHRKNILGENYTYCAVGRAIDPATGYAYWVALFTSEPE